MDRIGHAFFRVWRVPRVVLGKRIRLVFRVVLKVQMVVAGVVVGFNLPRTVSRGCFGAESGCGNWRCA